MTQYAVLATWTVDRSGVLESPPEAVAKVCNWLLQNAGSERWLGLPGIGSGVVSIACGSIRCSSRCPRRA